MNKGFWAKLNKPVMALAPMANVTDAAFRRVIAKYGKPDVMWTEFVSADGLLSAGRQALLQDLLYTEAERPIVAQFFTSKPELMERTAALAAEMGFDGVDINMGCPDRSIERSGAGAALIKDPKLAQEIIRAAQKGAGPLPVSVKTRLGYDRLEYKEWLPAILETGPAALSVHLRTRREMSEVPAHWEIAAEIPCLRDLYGPGTLILGNGDVSSLAEARRRTEEAGMDGAMIGRGIFGNPWLFSGHEPSAEEKLRVALEHVRLYEEIFGPDRNGRWKKGFDVMKKHFKAYVNGFDGAKELRAKLMEAENSVEVAELLAPERITVYNASP